MAFVDTSTNMVRVVQNIIESYGMGALRALAQEPVQNAKDAKRQSTVHVEYRLHTRRSLDGRPCHLLTVTDSGTTGLQGPILSKEQRDQRGLELGEGENWAAFEGQGFTRKDQRDALGSRGQGKSAFLYHSQPSDPGGNPLDRHLMLYDTLLEDGEYRLGVRYATPADRVMEPPFTNGDARRLLLGNYDTGHGTVVPLQLDPLEQPGTRVIVAYLSDEALYAIRNGELHRWLQRCWWRAIQIGDLAIRVTDDEDRSETIQVPDWWRDEPWKNGDSRVAVHGPIRIEDSLHIKRIVLRHDETLEKDEIDGYAAQYSGVQVLRGQQWIETLDVGEYIPKEHRGGFRGFVEFDVQLERELKNTERPQHESFDGRNPLVKRFREEVSRAVRRFAEERGWHSGAEVTEVPEREQKVATEFLNVFATGAGTTHRGSRDGKTGTDGESLNWSCDLKLDFPTPKTTRVNWGETIGNVRVTVECEPAQGSKWVDVSLEICRDGDSSASPVAQKKDIVIQDGAAVVEFGDFQIVQGRAGEGKIHIPESGEWKLQAQVRYGGEDVESARRRLYVATDPPNPPQPKPHTISVSAKNVTRQGEQRINNGDEIAVQVTVTNREADDALLEVDASLEHELLADGEQVSLQGVPIGDVPNRQAIVSKRLKVYTPSSRSAVSEPHIVLPPGRYFLRADLRSPGVEEPIAHASQPVYVEVNPSGNRHSRLPFELVSDEGEEVQAMWWLDDPSTDSSVLHYPKQYPLYRHLPERQRLSSKLAGKLSFIAEVCANGLLEWALAPLANGDSSRTEQLKDNRPSGVSSRRWDAYCERIDRLVEFYDTERIEHTGAYMSRWRESVADMLEIFEGLE